jgi:hypothetical protein
MQCPTDSVRFRFAGRANCALSIQSSLAIAATTTSAKLAGARRFSRRAPVVRISRPISRVLYGPLAQTSERDGHSSCTPVARRIVQPTRMTGPDGPRGFRRERHSYSVLLPVGFAVPLPLPAARCALTAPFHPCRGQNATQPRRSVLCGTVPEACPAKDHPAGHYPAPFVHGARTFLPTPPFGIGAERPSGRLTG